MVDASKLRVDPAASRLFGDDVVAQLAAMIDPRTGECGECHQPLGEVPVSLGVHRTAEALLVVPAHAACRPATLTEYAAGQLPAAPASMYKTAAVGLPLPADPATGQPRMLVAALLNPSVDVQAGRIVDGTWHSLWQDPGRIPGLAPLTAAGALPAGPATWGVTLPDETSMVVRSAFEQYRVPLPGWMRQVVHDSGACLVLVTDHVHTTDVDGENIGLADLEAAAEAGQLFGALAQLDAQPVVRFAAQEQAARELAAHGAPDGLSAPTTSTELAAAAADTTACARAVFADDPAIGLGALEARTSAGDRPVRVPVLLLEPRIALHIVEPGPNASAPREQHAEVAVGNGLQRALPGPTTLSLARAWQVRSRDGVVDLVAPGGDTVASGPLVAAPAWLDSADQLGCVLVIYGVAIGVRPAPGRPFSGDADRRAELDESRRAGAVAWGLVAWQG